MCWFLWIEPAGGESVQPSVRAVAGALEFVPASEAPEPNRKLRVWTTEQGLPQNWLTGIAQLPDRQLWTGSTSGLARFDGVEFRAFEPGDLPGLPSLSIFRMFVDHQGALWIETEPRSLFRSLDGRSFEPADVGLPPLPHRRYFDHPDWGVGSFDDDGALRVFDGQRWRPRFGPGAEPDAGRRSGPRSDSGTVRLVSDRSSRLALWTGAGLFSLVASTGESVLGSQAAYSRRDRLLFVRAGESLRRFVHEPLQALAGADGSAPLKARELPPIPLPAPIKTLLLDREDRLWMSFESGGLARLSGERVAMDRPEAPSGRLFEDAEGSLWLATSGEGLWQLLPPQAFAMDPQLEARGVRRVWTSLQAADGTLWVGTAKGLFRQTDGRLEPVEALRDTNVYSLAEGIAGRLWVGTQRGLWRQTPEGFEAVRLRPSGRHPAEIRGQIMPLANGEVWVASHAGLFRLRPPRFAGEPPIVDAIPLPSAGADRPIGRLRGLHLDRQGRLWIASAFFGPLRWNGERVEEVVDADLRVDARAFWESDDALWILTFGEGLVRLRNGRVDRVTEAHGLGDDTIHQIVPDTQGWLWMTSDRGVFRVRAEALDAVADGSLERLHSTVFGTGDGLATSECNSGHPGAIRLADGRLVIPTMAGLARVDPAHLLANRVPPAVRITGVHVGVGTRSVSDRLDAVESVRLDPRARSLSIDYAAATYVAPQETRYRYRLDGFDEEWIEAGSRRTALYTALPPGRYSFQVEAEHASGLRSPEVARLAIDVPPRWHERTSARLVGLVALALVGWRIGRWRLAHQHQAELEGLVAERTRELEDEMERTRQQAEEIRELRITLSAAEVDVEPAEAVFLRRVLAAVEENLHRSDFGVYELAEAIHLSRRQLHRKLVAATDETPAALLRRIRLERAAKLLRGGAGSVAEVAAAVGAKNPAHFSERFKKAYGQSPSAFLESR